MLNFILRDSLKKAQLGGFMNSFVHQLRSPGSRRSAGGALRTALCRGLGVGGSGGTMEVAHPLVKSLQKCGLSLEVSEGSAVSPRETDN